MKNLKVWLLTGASVGAIAAANSTGAYAADLGPRPALVTKAPPVTAYNPWTWWVEGGAQAVSGGDPSIPNLTPAFTPGKKTWGWDAAAAVDYRFNSIWHVSAAFRYGENKKRTSTGVQRAVDTTGYIFSGTTSADRKESNWVADFMVGRDLGFGGGTSQLKAGLRVAHIEGNTSGAGDLNLTAGFGYLIRQSYSQSNKWTGYGPRVAIEGNAPLSGPWSVDYMVGLAGLFGTQSINQTGANPSNLGFACATGCAATVSSSSNNVVFNADAMLGLAYAITPYAKLALNYRADYYANAVRTVSSTGAFSNTERLYHGANLRLTYKY